MIKIWADRKYDLYIVDRKRDMLIYKGYNVYPGDLEEIMAKHPAVQQCALVERLDPETGEVPSGVSKHFAAIHDPWSGINLSPYGL